MLSGICRDMVREIIDNVFVFAANYNMCVVWVSKNAGDPGKALSFEEEN